jgi:hypothetical protein
MKNLKFVTAALALSLAPFAMAGTPLICFPFDIGGAKSLPWNPDQGIGSPQAGYDTRHLADDTIRLLDATTPVIVRMETLRRAALYADKDVTAGRQVLERLKARAAGGKAGRDALAVFDCGYYMETRSQLNAEKAYAAGMAGAQQGYALVREAIQLRGNDPEMEFAAAVITLWPKRPQHQEHLQNAIAGAQNDALLASNLLSHFPSLGSTLANLRNGKTASSKRK